MKAHTEIGAHIVKGSRSTPLVQMVEWSVALTHHERWDGNGYTPGLEGEAIPLAGRIVAVADVYDALTHERPYKPAWTHTDALAQIRTERGRHFDPTLVDAFLRGHRATQAVALRRRWGWFSRCRLRYGRIEMPKPQTDRHREPGRTHAAALAAPELPPGPRAAALDRQSRRRCGCSPARRCRTGTVSIAGVGTIKVKGGNLEEWSGKAVLDYGRGHLREGQALRPSSRSMTTARTRTNVKVEIAATNAAGEELSVGGGTLLEIDDARIKGYSVDDKGVETWRVGGFENVKRTKITHKVS